MEKHPMTMNIPRIPVENLTNIVALERHRDELARRLEDVECMLWTEMEHLAFQLKAGKQIPPAAALVLARNELPDTEALC